MASIFNPGILVLSAPSGGGKTSLARALVARRNDVEITVSHTTREQRPGEEHGVHYYFVEKIDFETMIEKGEFIEYAQVFDNYYGTSIKALENLISRGKHAILDIDWQGARNVRRKYADAISVFVMPPSMEALEQRLRERRQDSEEVIARRMRDAANEMSHKDEFDIIITNDDFDNTADTLERILEKLGSTEHTEH
jgi:guanylate kinase